MQVTKHASEGPTLALKPGQPSPEVQNRDTSGPTKRNYVLQNKRQKNKFVQRNFLWTTTLTLN